MNLGNEKRMVADTGYEVSHSVTIGEREVLIAENMDDADGNYYLKAEYTSNGIIGQYDRICYSPDYLEVMEEFTKGIGCQITALRGEIGKADYQAALITADDCYPHDYGQEITGKVVAIKASALRPEYRRGDFQLAYVTHGNGARANPGSTGVYCCPLGDGSSTKFARQDVQGIIKVLPEWAKGRLEAYHAEKAAENLGEGHKAKQPEVVANYTVTKRIRVGRMLFVLGENPEAPSQFVTWQRMDGRHGYDLGHYFNNREDAVADLCKRANTEREKTTPIRALGQPGSSGAR